MRIGNSLTPREWDELQRPKHMPNGVIPVTIMARLDDVKKANDAQLLRQSDGQEQSWGALDDSKPLVPASKFVGSRLSKLLTLKVGAPVMLIVNLDDSNGLVNGARGVITGFETLSKFGKEDEVKNVRFGNQWKTSQITQYQVSKSSRPVVRFDPSPIHPDGFTKVIPVICDTVDFRGSGKCTRTQIPLGIAYSITYHKSQGMTIPYLILSTDFPAKGKHRQKPNEQGQQEQFEKGQFYTGISERHISKAFKSLDLESSLALRKK